MRQFIMSIIVHIINENNSTQTIHVRHGSEHQKTGKLSSQTAP